MSTLYWLPGSENEVYPKKNSVLFPQVFLTEPSPGNSISLTYLRGVSISNTLSFWVPFSKKVITKLLLTLLISYKIFSLCSGKTSFQFAF